MTLWDAVEVPEQIWLGKKSGEWPLFAFGTETSAKAWAAEPDARRRRYVIGPVLVPTSTPIRQAVIAPAIAVWKEDDMPQPAEES